MYIGNSIISLRAEGGENFEDVKTEAYNLSVKFDVDVKMYFNTESFIINKYTDLSKIKPNS